MLSTLVLPMPATLVDHHRIDLAASDGWALTTHDVNAAPTGEIYALYEVRRYYPRHDEENVRDPTEANFAYRILTRYTPDGQPQSTAYCTAWPTTSGPSIAGEEDLTLAVLPDGALAVSAKPDCTTLIAPDLSRIVARYAMPG
ncbi:hypothetical protein [Streptomyces sp. 3N207]|uniref:hypothetical protein n=1 Tax=Streptomyces sp. 3N207 TaxID=3457417 RepID=UPI003FD1C0E9